MKKNINISLLQEKKSARTGLNLKRDIEDPKKFFGKYWPFRSVRPWGRPSRRVREVIFRGPTGIVPKLPPYLRKKNDWIPEEMSSTDTGLIDYKDEVTLQDVRWAERMIEYRLLQDPNKGSDPKEVVEARIKRLAPFIKYAEKQFLPIVREQLIFQETFSQMHYYIANGYWRGLVLVMHPDWPEHVKNARYWSDELANI
jgi:hypothetical protein